MSECPNPNCPMHDCGENGLSWENHGYFEMCYCLEMSENIKKGIK